MHLLGSHLGIGVSGPIQDKSASFEILGKHESQTRMLPRSEYSNNGDELQSEDPIVKRAAALSSM